ncbi:MAG: hypothetical protein VXW22_13495, partial [Pseudomonadota bacterium]|nr:hypothetical protein [Pseudomonadota bacterium]
MKPRVLFIAFSALSAAFGCCHVTGETHPRAGLHNSTSIEAPLRTTQTKDFNSTGQFDDLTLEDARALLAQLAEALKDAEARLSQTDADDNLLANQYDVLDDQLDETEAEIEAAWERTGGDERGPVSLAGGALRDIPRSGGSLGRDSTGPCPPASA